MRVRALSVVMRFMFVCSLVDYRTKRSGTRSDDILRRVSYYFVVLLIFLKIPCIDPGLLSKIVFTVLYLSVIETHAWPQDVLKELLHVSMSQVQTHTGHS